MKNGGELGGDRLDKVEPGARELLIVGAGGMLGTALQRVGRQRGCGLTAYAEESLDITDRKAVVERVGEFAARAFAAGAQPVVVNAAAYTDVEKAEDDAESAYLVNERAAGWLAAVAHDQQLAFVHVSTDFVFDGAKQGAYVETDQPRPLSVYGASKLAGERAVMAGHPSALVIRTSWTYGPGGNSFPTKILGRARDIVRGAAADGVKAGAAAADAGPGATFQTAPTLQVVADEVGSPTYSVDLAEGLLALLSAGARGLYHLAGTGSCSRYELAMETLHLAGLSVPGDLALEPVPAAAFATKARRPPHSVLDCTKAAGLGVRLPAWQDGLARFTAEISAHA